MKKLLLIAFILALAPVTWAASKTLSPEQVTVMLEERFKGADIQNVAVAEVDSLYYFLLEGELYYITKDGKFLIKGQILDISNEEIRNLSRERTAQLEKLKSPMRKAEIAKLKEDDMVVYKAPNEQHVITIFTDIDCGYCQKLHRERQEYLDRGITIRYLAFPRAGLKSPSADKLTGIWCSNDPLKAMTDAKLHRKYENGNCQTPFEEHMSLVRKFGLRGTPGIILENGDLIGGYLPAEIMKQNLDKLTESSTASK